MTAPQVIDATIVLGAPGPAGAGVSSSQLSAIQAQTNHIFSGTGSPEGVVTGSVGDLYRQTDGVPSNDAPIFWIKLVGTADTRGWWAHDWFLLNRNVARAHADPGAATLSVSGTAAWTLGTGATNGDISVTGPFVNWATAATTNDAKGPNGPVVTQSGWGFDAAFRVRVVDITTVRLWIGLFDSDPSGTDGPSNNHAAFRFSTSGADDGNGHWRASTGDGAAGGRTDTGFSIAANNTYLLRMVGDATGVDFYINDAYQVRRTTNPPTSTAGLSPYVRVTTLANAIKNLRLSTFGCLTR